MGFRIQAVELENYGNIPTFKCSDFSNINLIIGENATGKTFFAESTVFCYPFYGRLQTRRRCSLYE